MNSMWHKIGLIVFCLLLGTANVHAYEFRRIEGLFTHINSKYAQSLDFSDMVQKSCDLVHSYDDTLRFYHSQTKVFLYQTNELVATLSIPQNSDVSAWQNFITTLLKESTKFSDKVALSARHLEDTLLQNTLKKLDKYSRLENNVFSDNGVDYRVQDNILYIRCYSFAAGTSEIIAKIIKRYPQISGFILDLKENHGGNFDEAIKTADLFLDKVLIAYRKEKNSSLHFYNAHAGDILEGKPMVVLTDVNTASAAEMVTAALQEQGRATLIGKKTFGKGCIQSVKDFTNQKLYLTSGYFFSPSGKVIHRVGVKPDICIDEEQNRGKTDFILAMEFIKLRINQI